jgi:hypothetical protein
VLATVRETATTASETAMAMVEQHKRDKRSFR